MAATGTSFKPPRQWKLTEKESITSFDSWKSNILYHLSLNNEFAPFLEGEWTSTANHGFQDDPAEQANRKTAVQKSILLDRLLGLIGQFVPSLLFKDVTKRSTSLSWIWKLLRKYYSFSKSEVNFLKLSAIHREENERFETLFQRILAHLEDNLLSTGSTLKHDGETPTVDETLSPTTERLAVYLWLMIIDKRLPAYVSREYAHDLQSMTLKDIQPRLAESMDSILENISTNEERHIQYTRSGYSNRQPAVRSRNYKPTPAPRKICILCRASGRPHVGHDASTCWFTSKYEKQQMARALLVETDEEHCSDEDLQGTESISYVQDGQPTTVLSEGKEVQVLQQMILHSPDKSNCSGIRKVQSSSSPYFYAFCKHTPCQVLIDTGATSSLISKSFLKLAGVTTKPTTHSARTVDKSSINLYGEVHIMIQFDDFNLPITALVVDKLDCDILGGVPFCEENDLELHLKNKEFSIQKKRYLYGAKSIVQTQNIFRTECIPLKTDTDTVVMPGDYVEIFNNSLLGFEGEVAVEPHVQSPQNWPFPSISRVIQGRIRIPNLGDDPVHLLRSQHIVNLCRVLNEPLEQFSTNYSTTSVSLVDTQTETHAYHSASIHLDVDGQLPVKDRQLFTNSHREYDVVFDPKIMTYNDRFGVVRSNVQIGPVLPPPRKGRIPMYNQSKLKILQEESDKLEKLGVLAPPGDVGIDHVLHVSPSFLLKKPGGTDTGYRYVTAFNELAQYTRILPTVSRSCDEVIRKLASFKYLIKCDLTKSFYQIKVTKKSIPF